MPHIYIPETYISQDDYNMIQDNSIPIDAFVAARIRNDEMLLYCKPLLFILALGLCIIVCGLSLVVVLISVSVI